MNNTLPIVAARVLLSLIFIVAGFGKLSRDMLAAMLEHDAPAEACEASMAAREASASARVALASIEE